MPRIRSRPPALPHDPSPPPAGALDVPRVLGRIDGDPNAPTLVVFGGVHGNEPAGVLALQRVLATLEADGSGLKGTLVALSGNRASLSRGRRYLDEDLNRIWTPARLRRVRDGRSGPSVEEAELRELDRTLAGVVASVTGPIAFLDLHSTSGGGAPFASLDDTLSNRELAFGLPVTHVLGLEEELAGTLVGHLNELGFAAVGFEAGQHADPASVERAEAAVWIVLESAGTIGPGERGEVQRSWRLLRDACRHNPHVVEVRYRHGLAPGCAFAMDPGYANFQLVHQGERLALHDEQVVPAPLDGLILMPLYQPQGDDGFFIVRPVRPVWLALSAVLRRLGLQRVLHWLPGVERDPADDDTLVIDRRRARWLALEIFHILGFKRRGLAGDTLRMTRRSHDPPRGGPDAARAWE